MGEWIAKSIMDGKDGSGNYLGYKRAMMNIKNKYPKKFNKLKEEVDRILLVNNREDLIEEL